MGKKKESISLGLTTNNIYNCAQMHTMKLLLIFNMGSFGVVLLLTMLLMKGKPRLSVVGWICAVFSVAVCAAPLSIMVITSQSLISFMHAFSIYNEDVLIYIKETESWMLQRRVVRTKSVEYLPFTLSASITLNAVMWFFYGLLQHDYYIAVSNIDQFIFNLLRLVCLSKAPHSPAH
jgi:solute carrier family 50 protein (sugar transporter)